MKGMVAMKASQERIRTLDESRRKEEKKNDFSLN